MQTQKSSTGIYVLGQAPEAIQRLLKQGQLINPFMRRMLEEVGLSSGMNVLDLGCGPGDVSLLAAELVGKTGRVLGIDTNPAVLQLARARTHEAGFEHVTFQASDVRDLDLDQEYDAIVGRLILMYLPDRAEVLHRLAQRLQPGGILAFQEYDLSEDNGSFLEAGLPTPRMRYESVIDGGPACPVYDLLADVIRALLPNLVKFGIATFEEVDIDTLADRLRAEIVRHNGVARGPAVVSAWVRKL